MPHANIKLRLNDAEEFDKAVHGGLPEGGDLTIITKDAGTEEGRACACLTFTVQTPDGKLHKAQTVTTVRLLRMVLAGLDKRYAEGKAKS